MYSFWYYVDSMQRVRIRELNQNHASSEQNEQRRQNQRISNNNVSRVRRNNQNHADASSSRNLQAPVNRPAIRPMENWPECDENEMNLFPMLHSTCPICLEYYRRIRPYSTNCGHIFCQRCIYQWLTIR